MLEVQHQKKEDGETNDKKKEIRKMKSRFDSNEKQFSEADRRALENNRLRGSGTGTFRKTASGFNSERERSGYRGDERSRERSVYRDGKHRGNHREDDGYYRNRRNFQPDNRKPGVEREDSRRYERGVDGRHEREDRNHYDQRRGENNPSYSRRRDFRSPAANHRESYRLPTRVEESFSSMINVVREISDNRRDDKKLDPPPSWDENMSPEAWARYVRIWNKAEVKHYRKAQALIEDLKKNDKKKGLKELIVNEIV